MLYDLLGRPERIERYSDLAGNSLVAQTDYAFDDLDRLTGLTHHDNATPTQKTFADYDYLYDVAGRITDFDFSSYAGDSGDATYTHDDTGQLTDADYDADWQTDGTYRYTYDEEGNQKLRFKDLDTSGTLNTNDTDITEYTWDHRNRLTVVTHYATEATYTSSTPDKIVEYAYDSANRWVRKLLDADGDGTPNNRTIFVYDGDQIALQFDDTTPANATEDTDLSHRYLV